MSISPYISQKGEYKQISKRESAQKVYDNLLYEEDINDFDPLFKNLEFLFTQPLLGKVKFIENNNYVILPTYKKNIIVVK